MSKSKKFILRAIPVLLLVVVLVASPVFGFDSFSDVDKLENNVKDKTGNANESTTLNNAIGGIWGTITLILQIAAVGAIVFAGVKYMFASASDKANIKNQLIILVVGAVLVFGASTIVRLLTSATQDLAGVN